MMKKHHFRIFYGRVIKMSVLILCIFVIGNLYGTTRQKITYVIEIDEEKWNSLFVSITIEHNRNGQLLCTMPTWAPGIYAKEKFVQDISEFKVVGDLTPEIQAQRTNDNSWLINAGKNDLIIISYKIKRKHDPFLGECIAKDFAWINSATMFLFIRELVNYPINLVVNVPYGWKLATSLTQATEDFEYSAINYYQLIEHPMYLGTFSDIYFSTQRGDGYVLLDSPQNFDFDRLAVITRQIVAYQTFLLLAQPLDKYLFIFRVLPDQKEAAALAFQNSSIFYVPAYFIKNDLNLLGKTIASNLFKRWFGPQFLLETWRKDNLDFIPRTTLLWFCEGICDYYGSLSMIRGGFWSQDDFIQHYVQSINELLRHPNYLFPPVAELSYNILEENYAESLQLLKLKGELLCLLIDLKIREATNNLKNTDDVVRFIKNWFKENQRSLQSDQLLNTLNGITSIDFTNFFDLFVNGNAELPFLESFQHAGIMLESKMDTIPDLGEFRLDETNKVIQLANDSPLFLSGLKKGDQILALKGIKCQGNKELNQIIDSLQVGSETELTIRREGLSLVVSLKVAGKEVKVINFKSIDEQTERAIAIRESWLTGRRIDINKAAKAK